jgi:hypothetical protein
MQDTNNEPYFAQYEAPAALERGSINQNNLIMQNKPNFSKSQMFITASITTNYNEKSAVDTWSKQTQFKPKTKPKQTQSNPILSAVALAEATIVFRIASCVMRIA